MPPTDDSVLLRQYAEHHSDEAFAALVTRHINLVYSVAWRCVGDTHQAEEIAQAVFILLAKRAAQLRHDKALSSWLFQTTRLTARNFVRSETRRHRREQEAHMQSVSNDSGSDPWPTIAPLLDDAVAGLSEKERHAIVLRFYEGRNLREVGAALGASEDAAEKRVHRAVEKLRSFFAKRGVTVGASGLVLLLSAKAVQAAPLGLGVTISTIAALGSTTAAAAKAIAMTTLQKSLIATALAAAVGTGIYEIAKISMSKPAPAPGAASLTATEDSRLMPVSLEQAGGKPLASYPPDKDWSAVPQGRQILDRVPFDVLTKLQLQGIVDATNNRMYPARVIGIPVQQRLARLHLLHGANLPDRVGRPIGALRLHYADGVKHTLFITYGVHVRHWWREYGETDAVRDTNSVLAWSGRSPDSDQKNTTHRLYKSSIDLPSRTQPLESIDVFTLFGDSSYVVLAMTGEAPSADGQTSPPAPSADETRFRDDLVVKVSDSAGNPIGGARIRGVAISERAEDDIPLARMEDSLEEAGTVPVDFPTGTQELRLVASAPGFVARELNLKPSEGRRFSREVSVKLEPGVRIGGFVRDPEGNPVAKAKVEMLRPTHEGAGHVSYFKFEEATANSQGRWTIREAPESLDNLLFRVTHADFHRGEFEFSGEADTGHLTREALLRSRAEFKLSP
jgi:RNA polymerase sigma factor (sigma-70 family)